MFHLKLFGGASVEGPSGPLTGRAVQRRRLALLSVLAVARGRGVARDRLVALLWPDTTSERARHQLSDSVYRINQALGGEAIIAAGDELRLNALKLSSDVDEFAAAVERGEWAPAAELSAAPFLDGFYLPDGGDFERWADGERARLRRERARALEALAEAAEDRAAHAQAADWWRALAADDPYSSRIALRLMRALEAAGERTAAVQHARVHTVLVREDMGVEPDAEIAALAERLRAAPAAAASSASPPAIEGPLRAAAAAQPAAADGLRGRTAAPAAAVANRRRSLRQLLATAAGVVLVAAVTLVLLVRDGRSTEGGISAVPAAVAVLPFDDLSERGDQEYFADGITEELIVRLSRIEGFAVVGRTSAFAIKGQALDVRDIAERLGVDVVLSGSVRRSGDRLRIFAQLVDARTGFELWSQTYERQAEDVFAIQDEIARAIVQRLNGGLAGGDTASFVEAAVVDPDVYNLYLRGRYEWHQRTEQGLRSAALLLAEAVERAPGYARAWAGLGDAYAVLGFYDYMPPARAFPAAADAAKRALALDPTLAEPHATLGYVALYHDWEWERAEAEFRRTVDMDPRYSTGRQWYANFLTAMGRFDEAVGEMRAAQELDPLSLIANAALGWVLYYAGDYERAADQLTRTLELDARFQLAYLWRGLVRMEMRDMTGAFADLERAVDLSGGSAISTAALAYARAVSGDRDGAATALRALEHRAGDAYAPAFEIAKVHLALGDRASAMRWLERAHAQHEHSIAFLAVDPQLKSLRGAAAFESLLRRAGLDVVRRRGGPAGG